MGLVKKKRIVKENEHLLLLSVTAISLITLCLFPFPAKQQQSAQNLDGKL